MNTSAIVLVGGHSRRMGTDKALLQINGESFLSIIVRKVMTITDDVWVVGRHSNNHVQTVAPLPAQFIEDSFANCGPLGGLHAGLQAMQHEAGIVVACDAPLISPALLQHMASLLNGDYDAVVPRDDSGWHPLHAVYHKRCAALVEQSIRAGNRRVQDLLKLLRVRVIEPSEVAQFDLQGFSLRNLNTPEDYQDLLRT